MLYNKVLLFKTENDFLTPAYMFSIHNTIIILNRICEMEKLLDMGLLLFLSPKTVNLFDYNYQMNFLHLMAKQH